MYQSSSCRGFAVLLQLLKSKNSVQTCFAKNNTFASCANMSKLLLFSDDFWLDRDFSETGRQFPTISVADGGLGDMCFPAGLHYP